MVNSNMVIWNVIGGKKVEGWAGDKKLKSYLYIKGIVSISILLWIILYCLYYYGTLIPEFNKTIDKTILPMTEKDKKLVLHNNILGKDSLQKYTVKASPKNNNPKNNSQKNNNQAQYLKVIKSISYDLNKKAIGTKVTSQIINPYNVLKDDITKTKNNRLTDNINIMIFWVDHSRLKVLSILTINPHNNKIATITLPLFGQFLDGSRVTSIEGYYRENGWRKIKSKMEELMEIKIDNYVKIEQSTLQKVSSIIGLVKVKEEELYIAKAFEDTFTGKRKDDQDIVRALGEKLISKRQWYKIPKLVWLFSKEVKTNFAAGQMWEIYKITRNTNISKLLKQPLGGMDHKIGKLEYRIFLARYNKNIIYELTK